MLHCYSHVNIKPTVVVVVGKDEGYEIIVLYFSNRGTICILYRTDKNTGSHDMTDI